MEEGCVHENESLIKMEGSLTGMEEMLAVPKNKKISKQRKCTQIKGILVVHLTVQCCQTHPKAVPLH